MNFPFPIPINTQHYLLWHRYGLYNRCEASSGFDQQLFRTLLSYLMHFWFSLIINLKNGPISFRFSSDSQLGTRSIKFFIVISYGTQVSSFFWYSVLCKWFWSILRSVAMSRDELYRFHRLFQRFAGQGEIRKRVNQFWPSVDLSTYHHKHSTIFDVLDLNFSLCGRKNVKYD